MAICMMCLEEVEQDVLFEEFGHIFAQADMLGAESLTEHEQVVLENRLCGQDCYYSMQDAEYDYFKVSKKVSLVRGLRDDPDFLGSTGPTAGDDF